MADMSPFLSTPAQWVEKLAQLRAERQKIEEAEDRLRKKLLEYLKANNLESLEADQFVAVLQKREASDFTQKALEAEFGALWLAAAKERLPIKLSESLVVKAKKEKEDVGDALQTFFSKDGGK